MVHELCSWNLMTLELKINVVVNLLMKYVRSKQTYGLTIYKNG